MTIKYSSVIPSWRIPQVWRTKSLWIHILFTLLITVWQWFVQRDYKPGCLGAASSPLHLNLIRISVWKLLSTFNSGLFVAQLSSCPPSQLRRPALSLLSPSMRTSPWSVKPKGIPSQSEFGSSHDFRWEEGDRKSLITVKAPICWCLGALVWNEKIHSLIHIHRWRTFSAVSVLSFSL